ncbi:formate dehydrogenase accessory sulfurtransferase FdhD [Methanocorpusculum labreanum]|nr:formate dehydrogenase accessory sulfurtransferase FdhD [Methanocorpusculum labreanum]
MQESAESNTDPAQGTTMSLQETTTDTSGMTEKLPAVLWNEGEVTHICDTAAREEEIVLYLNGREYLHIVASPNMLLEFGAGYFTAAGIAEKILSVRIDDKNVFVEADLFPGAGPREGFAPAEKKGHVVSELLITPEEIFAVRKAMDVDVWRQTGGLHCAALWHDHKIIAVSSDIGRHNAVDKLIGFMTLQGIPPGECVLGCTGRQPKGMVMKAVNAGIPVIVGRTAVTYPGAMLAKEEGVTLIGFTRENRFTVYSHPERIAGFPAEEPENGKGTENNGELLLSGWQYDKGSVKPAVDVVVLEDTVTLYLNGEKYLDNTATLESLEELGAGFFIAAGITKKIRSVKVRDADIFVEADEVAEVCGKMESAGGFCPRESAVNVEGGITISPEEIFTVREQINTEEWDKTGALHCAVLYYQGEVVYSANDIGRHNAVDKVIGYMTLHRLPAGKCVLGCTGRMPHGMVSKAANAGIPVIVSRAATTSTGAALAERSGITLICFTRPPRFTVYSHPERIVGLGYEKGI